jgi:hypothetical protein
MGIDVQRQDKDKMVGMQYLIQREVELHQCSVLNREFRALPATDKRRTAWINVDAFSSQWVSTWRGEGELSPRGWEYVTATYMGLPVPSLRPLVGRRFKAAGTQYTVGPYGDVLMAARLKGPSWMDRHNAVLHAVRDIVGLFGVRVTIEPHGLFRQCLVEPLQRARYDAHVHRSGRRDIVPDAAIMLSMDEGPISPILVGVKAMACCPTRYPPRANPGRKIAVRTRASLIPAEYEAKARQTDDAVLGTAEVGDGGRNMGAGVVRRENGPVHARLLELGHVKPLVVGAFGEMSKFAEELIAAVATVGAGREWRRMRCDSEKHCKAILQPMLRRHLGMAGIMANARCFISRLGTFDAPDGMLDVPPRARVFLRRRRETALDHFGECRVSRAV